MKKCWKNEQKEENKKEEHTRIFLCVWIYSPKREIISIPIKYMVQNPLQTKRKDNFDQKMSIKGKRSINDERMVQHGGGAYLCKIQNLR